MSLHSEVQKIDAQSKNALPMLKNPMPTLSKADC